MLACQLNATLLLPSWKPPVGAVEVAVGCGCAYSDKLLLESTVSQTNYS